MARRGVYVLLLEGSRYYVGSSADVARRVAAHRAGTGAAFTRRFGVVDDVAPLTFYNDDIESWERAETLARMREHGVDRVRGWLYTTVRLSASQRASVREQLRERFGQCRRCGASGHYVAECTGAQRAQRAPRAPRRALRGGDQARVGAEARVEHETVHGDSDARRVHRIPDENAEERGAHGAADDARGAPEVRTAEAEDQVLLRADAERVEGGARHERRA
jgi:hypothetical protein